MTKKPTNHERTMETHFATTVFKWFSAIMILMLIIAFVIYFNQFSEWVVHNQIIQISVPFLIIILIVLIGYDLWLRYQRLNTKSNQEGHSHEN